MQLTRLAASLDYDPRRGEERRRHRVFDMVAVIEAVEFSPRWNGSTWATPRRISTITWLVGGGPVEQGRILGEVVRVERRRRRRRGLRLPPGHRRGAAGAAGGPTGRDPRGEAIGASSGWTGTRSRFCCNRGCRGLGGAGAKQGRSGAGGSVGSTNPAKVEAVRTVFSRAFDGVQVLPVPVGAARRHRRDARGRAGAGGGHFPRPGCGGRRRAFRRGP